MSHPSSDRSTADVTLFSVIGLLFLMPSFLPVGPDNRGLLLGLTMPVALMSTWIATGLGLYGMVRYPSRRMFLAATVSVSSAALCGLRFWRLALAT